MPGTPPPTRLHSGQRSGWGPPQPWGQALTGRPVSPGVHRGLPRDDGGPRRAALRPRQLRQRVRQGEPPGGRGPSLGAGHDPEKVSVRAGPRPSRAVFPALCAAGIPSLQLCSVQSAWACLTRGRGCVAGRAWVLGPAALRSDSASAAAQPCDLGRALNLWEPSFHPWLIAPTSQGCSKDPGRRWGGGGGAGEGVHDGC